MENLPIHVMDEIFSYLESKQIIRLRAINFAFKDFIDSLPVQSSGKFDVSDVRIINNKLVLRVQYDNIGDYDTNDFYEVELPNSGVALKWIKTYTFIYERSTILRTRGYFKNFFAQITTFTFKSENFADLCEYIKIMPKLNNLVIEKRISEKEVIKMLTCIKICRQTTFFLSFDNVSLTRQVVDLFLSVMENVEEHDLFVYPGIGEISDPTINDAQQYYIEMRIKQKKVPKFLEEYYTN